MEIEPGCGKWAARINWAARIIWAARIKWAFFKECTTPELQREEKIFYEFKKLTRPSWSIQEKLLKKKLNAIFSAAQ